MVRSAGSARRQDKRNGAADARLFALYRTSMKIQITGRNFDVGDALRDYARERLERVAEKYFSTAHSGQFTLTREAGAFKADCLVHIGTGIELKVEARAGDPHAAVDEAIGKLEKRLRRYKRRLRNHHAERSEPARRFDVASYVIRPTDEESGEAGDLSPVIVAESQTAIQELTVGEAVMQLDISEQPFLVFRNGGLGRINVVYRREDGNIGWIDPEFVEQVQS